MLFQHKQFQDWAPRCAVALIFQTRKPRRWDAMTVTSFLTGAMDVAPIDGHSSLLSKFLSSASPAVGLKKTSSGSDLLGIFRKPAPGGNTAAAKRASIDGGGVVATIVVNPAASADGGGDCSPTIPDRASLRPSLSGTQLRSSGGDDNVSLGGSCSSVGGGGASAGGPVAASLLRTLRSAVDAPQFAKAEAPLTASWVSLDGIHRYIREARSRHAVLLSAAALTVLEVPEDLPATSATRQRSGRRWSGGGGGVAGETETARQLSGRDFSELSVSRAPPAMVRRPRRGWHVRLKATDLASITIPHATLHFDAGNGCSSGGGSLGGDSVAPRRFDLVLRARDGGFLWLHCDSSELRGALVQALSDWYEIALNEELDVDTAEEASLRRTLCPPGRRGGGGGGAGGAGANGGGGGSLLAACKPLMWQ
ncbi:unnamed protein product [Phaeothamnion confervicola]